jgi:hypothetical protein
MISRTLARRLERLEARLRPDAPLVLKILVTRIGGPDKIIELVLNKPNGWRRGFWDRKREGFG